ncbi:major facilitator superfamily domain-containing protein [Aspergillus heterothallicus]
MAMSGDIEEKKASQPPRELAGANADKDAENAVLRGDSSSPGAGSESCIDSRDSECDAGAGEVERWNYPRANVYKTFATFWAFLVMGANDSAYGPLIPYLETHYNLSYTTVSLVFLSPIGGYTLAALTNNILHLRFGRRGIAILSPGCHLIAYIVNCLHPPYPVLVVSFIFAGLGNGLADSAWNAWIGNMADSNQMLGLLHGWYGLGAVLAPLVATSLITEAKVGWWYFYYIMGTYTIQVACAAIEVATCIWAFRTSDAASFAAEQASQNSSSSSSPSGGDAEPGGVRRALFVPRYAWVTWILAFFLLGYVGVEVAIGGWIVTFLMRVRDGGDFASGMGSTGFWLGITCGRVVLGFVTPRIGEKIAIVIYYILAIALALILWLVPSFYASVIAVSIQGFFLGPMFPGAVVVATRLLPRSMHVSAIGFAAAFGERG